MGVTVAIEAPDEGTRARLARQWSRAVVDEVRGEPVEKVRASGATLHDGADYALTTQVTMAALRATRGHRLNLHAGGLADAAGRVIALVAPSGTGKTTTTRLLAQHLAYLSDETVSMDPDGRVYPHAKPLSVIPEDGVSPIKKQLSPDDLGLLPTKGEVRLARFLVLRRGVPDPRGLVLLDTVEGILELVEQSSSLVELPEPLTTLVRLVGATGGVWALEYDEIDQHIEEVLGLLAADIPVAEDVLPVRHVKGVSPTQATHDQFARASWKDAVEIGDDLVVLLESRAVHLHTLMATLWLALTDPQTLEELVNAAQARHGVHPEAVDLVGRALQIMIQQGLVVRGPLA
jgi:hypothetical protein